MDLQHGGTPGSLGSLNDRRRPNQVIHIECSGCILSCDVQGQHERLDYIASAPFGGSREDSRARAAGGGVTFCCAFRQVFGGWSLRHCQAADHLGDRVLRADIAWEDNVWHALYTAQAMSQLQRDNGMHFMPCALVRTPKNELLAAAGRLLSSGTTAFKGNFEGEEAAAGAVSNLVAAARAKGPEWDTRSCLPDNHGRTRPHGLCRQVRGRNAALGKEEPRARLQQCIGAICIKQRNATTPVESVQTTTKHDCS